MLAQSGVFVVPEERKMDFTFHDYELADRVPFEPKKYLLKPIVGNRC